MKKHFLFFVIILSCIFNPAQTREDQELQSHSQESVQKTLYVYRPLINGYDLRNWAEEQGLTMLSEDMHVTLAYSRGGVENLSDGLEADSNYVSNADPNSLRQLAFFGKEKSILVLKLNAPELVARWEELIVACANWDWPIFEPHVTLSYAAKEVDLEQIKPYAGDLIFGPEVWVEFD